MTGNGRQALGLALSGVEQVLVPAFICTSVVQALEESGKAVKFYRVSEYLEADPDDLLPQIKSHAAVIWVHYFGFPQRLDLLKSLRDQSECIVIEDCAHAFLSSAGKQPLGSLGHYGFFSFRKTVPVTEGGALMLNRAAPGLPKAKRASNLKALKGSLDLTVRGLEIRLGFRLKALRTAFRARKALSTMAPANGLAQQKPAPLTCYLLARFDYEEIRRRRRENYRLLQKVLEGVPGLRPVFPSLPEGVCPMAFPLWVADRDCVQAALAQAGVEAYPWPDLPSRVGPEHLGGVSRMARRLLLLPIHQNVGAKSIERMGRVMRQAVG